MYPGYPFDYPSTSAMPQMPVQQRLAPREFGRLRAQDFLNPYASQNSSQHSSPAHSVMSAVSGMSIGSGMSVMSRLSISTQLSTTLPYHSASLKPASQENQPPLTFENIASVYKFIMNYLSDHQFWRLMQQKEVRAKLFNNMHFLITGRITMADGKKIMGLRHLGEERFTELVKMMFKRLYIDQETFENLAQERDVWNECIYFLLKNLVMILSDLKLCDYVVMKMTSSHVKSSDGWGNPVATLFTFFRESQKYTSNAVLAMRVMVFSSMNSIKRFRRSYLRDPNYAKAIAEKLVQLVDTDDLNTTLKSHSLDIICQLLRIPNPEVALIFIVYPNVLPRLLERCFQLQCEEQLIHKMTHFLLKVSTFKSSIPSETEEINDSFMKHFIAIGGFTIVTEMLSHGSPRVLVGCLEFLVTHSHKKWIMEQVDYKPIVGAVLKVLCSSEPLIVRHSVHFLMNIVVKKSGLKELVTQRRGAEMAIQLMCQEYPQSYDPKLDLTKLNLLKNDICSNALTLLNKLLTSDNLECTGAARQIIDMPLSSKIFVYQRSIDKSAIDLLEILQQLTTLAPERIKEMMQWSRGKRLLAEEIVCYIFTVFIYYDKIVNEPEMAKLYLEVRNKCFYIIMAAGKADVETAALIAKYIGKTTLNEKDCLIHLFSATHDKNMQRDLLKFLATMANCTHPCLKSLPTIWARHQHFEYFMSTFAQSEDSEAASWSQFLIQLSRAM